MHEQPCERVLVADVTGASRVLLRGCWDHAGWVAAAVKTQRR